MKMNNFKAVFMTVSILLFGATQVLANAKLNKQDISDFSDSLQQAVKNQDVDELMSHFSSDAKIQMNMPEYLGGTLEMALKDYKAMLAISWSISADFTYEIKDTTTSLGKSGETAILKETILETMAIDGEVMTSTSSIQTSKIVLVSGKPKIVSIQMDVTMLGM